MKDDLSKKLNQLQIRESITKRKEIENGKKLPLIRKIEILKSENAKNECQNKIRLCAINVILNSIYIRKK